MLKNPMQKSQIRNSSWQKVDELEGGGTTSRPLGHHGRRLKREVDWPRGHGLRDKMYYIAERCQFSNGLAIKCQNLSLLVKLVDFFPQSENWFFFFLISWWISAYQRRVWHPSLHLFFFLFQRCRLPWSTQRVEPHCHLHPWWKFDYKCYGIFMLPDLFIYLVGCL